MKEIKMFVGAWADSGKDVGGKVIREGFVPVSEPWPWYYLPFPITASCVGISDYSIIVQKIRPGPVCSLIPDPTWVIGWGTG